MLRGSYRATVEQKGRLKIPVVFLEELKQYGEEFFVTSMNGDRARIYPIKVWEEIEEKLARQPLHNETKQKFLARANYYGQVVKLDKQGRVLIPPVLRTSADLKGEVAVLPSQGFLEVWNNERFVKHLNQTPFTAEDAKILNEFGV